jgi:hypothetical protein
LKFPVISLILDMCSRPMHCRGLLVGTGAGSEAASVRCTNSKGIGGAGQDALAGCRV